VFTELPQQPFIHCPFSYDVPIETSHRCFVEGKMNFAKTAKIQWEI